jgi:hypothetical protein
VSRCDILLSLDLKFKEQEGAGPPLIILSKRSGTNPLPPAGEGANGISIISIMKASYKMLCQEVLNE